jgi:SH3-like domain-containing protein
MKSQKGAFKSLANAKACADKNPGYSVYDESGKAVYPTSTPAPTPAPSTTAPYLVEVKATDLNIRKGPGTNYATTGKYTGKGVFTIVEEKSGQGSVKGWGKLKSGAGWISLDYTTKL